MESEFTLKQVASMDVPGEVCKIECTQDVMAIVFQHQNKFKIALAKISQNETKRKRFLAYSPCSLKHLLEIKHPNPHEKVQVLCFLHTNFSLEPILVGSTLNKTHFWKLDGTLLFSTDVLIATVWKKYHLINHHLQTAELELVENSSSDKPSYQLVWKGKRHPKFARIKHKNGDSVITAEPLTIATWNATDKQFDTYVARSFQGAEISCWNNHFISFLYSRKFTACVRNAKGAILQDVTGRFKEDRYRGFMDVNGYLCATDRKAIYFWNLQGNEISFPIKHKVQVLASWGNRLVKAAYQHDSSSVEVWGMFVPWVLERVLWIGWHKNCPQKCLLASLPKETLKCIIMFWNQHLYAKDIFQKKPRARQNTNKNKKVEEDEGTENKKRKAVVMQKRGKRSQATSVRTTD